MQRVKVHDWLIGCANILLGCVAEYETQTDGRGGQNEQNSMQDLCIYLATTLERSVNEHRLSIEEDESNEHECSVGIELLFAVVLPS